MAFLGVGMKTSQFLRYCICMCSLSFSLGSFTPVFLCVFLFWLIWFLFFFNASLNSDEREGKDVDLVGG